MEWWRLNFLNCSQPTLLFWQIWFLMLVLFPFFFPLDSVNHHVDLLVKLSRKPVKISASLWRMKKAYGLILNVAILVRSQGTKIVAPLRPQSSTSERERDQGSKGAITDISSLARSFLAYAYPPSLRFRRHPQSWSSGMIRNLMSCQKQSKNRRRYLRNLIFTGPFPHPW